MSQISAGRYDIVFINSLHFANDTTLIKSLSKNVKISRCIENLSSEIQKL
jgi:hypothetical protein